VVWNAYKAANKPFVATAVSDNNGDLAGYQIPARPLSPSAIRPLWVGVASQSP
jgi:hypothetical protein